MLIVRRKADYLTGTRLSPAEDGAKRKAFCRFAAQEFRQAGAELVLRYQQQGHGNWLLWGCLDSHEKGLQDAYSA